MTEKVSISLDRRQWAIVGLVLASMEQSARLVATFNFANEPIPTDAEMLCIALAMERQASNLPPVKPCRPCPECAGPTKQDHNSFWCDQCKMLWPLPEDIKPT